MADSVGKVLPNLEEKEGDHGGIKANSSQNLSFRIAVSMAEFHTEVQIRGGHPPLESLMRSKTTPKKRLPKSQLWAYALRLSPELEAPLRQRAADRGGTLQDEIELAVRAWLKVPLPVNYIPEGMEMTLLDEIMCKMKHSNGQSMKSLAEEFHVPYWKMRQICK